jgi:hypothetical protein
MILEGDFVLDWMGRAGIAIDKTAPPDLDRLNPIFDRRLKEMRETETWWLVALFSGSVVKSPELLTDSHGKATVGILRWAVRRCAPYIRSRLDSILETEQAAGNSIN